MPWSPPAATPASASGKMLPEAMEPLIAGLRALQQEFPEQRIPIPRFPSPEKLTLSGVDSVLACIREALKRGEYPPPANGEPDDESK